MAETGRKIHMYKITVFLNLGYKMKKPKFRDLRVILQKYVTTVPPATYSQYVTAKLMTKLTKY